MWIRQMFVVLLSIIFLTQQQITAVVNNPQTTSTNIEEVSTTNTKEVISSNSASSSTGTVADSIAANTDNDGNRREAPLLTLSDSYGVPLSSGSSDSYIPSGPSNPNLPIPVYGVPDSPSNNIIYPAPPPDIPPPLPPISNNFIGSLDIYGPPKPISIPPTDNFLSPPTKYGPPPIPSRPIKPIYHIPKPPKHSYGPPPRPQYGPPPPKPLFIQKLPKPTYGLPKPQYGPPNKHHFSSGKPLNLQKPFRPLPQVTILSAPPKDNYGPPLNNFDNHISIPQPHYGPPEPIPHGPPHPGAPAPPTPPDIKYDGWQPIPGLVSRPPSDSYGVPEYQQHGSEDLHFNSDFTPPPVGGHNSISSSASHHSSTHTISNTYGTPSNTYGTPSNTYGAPSDSYGAPLNAVTGSGGIISSSGDKHHSEHSIGLSGISSGGSDQGHLSVIKSIGYELFPNGGNSYLPPPSSGFDSYTAPPLSSYSPTGPYAAAHSYKNNGISSSFTTSSSGSHNSHGISFSSSGIGLIPPSGIYGVPPSGQYGTPLISKQNNYLNALKINPPKHPVVFREPVPTGLIESIGQHTAQKDAHGIIESSHLSSYSSGPTYIPPPIPDISKPVQEDEPPHPSNLYSLPSSNAPVSFQNLALGSSTSGLGSYSFNSGFGGAHAEALTSYTAPLGAVDGSYGLPAGGSVSSHGLTVGLDNSHPPLTIDLTSSTNNGVSSLSNPYAYHDCSLHKSQPLPSLSYGVPSANSYTASLSTLTTNIGGGYQGSSPSLNYGIPDLHTAHSQTISSESSASNAIENDLKEHENYGKSLAQNFGPDSELIKSQSIDLNNIPLQGSQGSYTLQIQSADGLNPSNQIPHTQVLNDGLLQSILAAIEQPQQKGANILGQPLIHLQPNIEQTQNYAQNYAPSALGDIQDAEPQHSVTNAVAVSPPVTEVSTSTNETLPTTKTETDTDASLRIIDNNEIALYFSNNSQQEKIDENNNINGQLNNKDTSIRNGQQYGTYVSFKTPTSSYVYGDLKSETGQTITNVQK